MKEVKKMSLRIATTIEDDHLKLVKVRTCRGCPNAHEEGITAHVAAQAGQEKKPPPQRPVTCDVRDGAHITDDLDKKISGSCPLPSLLALSKMVGKKEL